MGLTLLFNELENIKVKDLKIRPSIKKDDVKKYLNDGCESDVWIYKENKRNSINFFNQRR